MKRALLSVWDKSGLIPFASGLAAAGYELISTGGTARVLAEAGLPVTNVSEVTGFPEILDGRVKTLHPAIHGGILARREQAHLAELATQAILPIDIVVCNLYPFEATISKPDVKLDEAIEQIDIGGVTLLRAAAKNHAYVTVVVNPEDYDVVLAELAQQGQVSLATRQRLAVQAFRHTAHYDVIIASYLEKVLLKSDSPFPTTLQLSLPKAAELRYGENPHQRAAAYLSNTLGGRELSDQPLSYNNLLDIDGAWRTVSDFDVPTVAIIKHGTPCGVASDEDLVRAYQMAFETDTLSPFGGIIAVNRTIDERFVEAWGELMVDAVVAPGYSEEALKILRRRRRCRVLEIPPGSPEGLPWEVRSVRGGLILQERDTLIEDESQWRVVSKRTPTPEEWKSLRFAWKVVKHVKSNAIVLADKIKDSEGRATTGIGGGQTSRVDAVRLAVSKAGARAKGSVLASDAYIPFEDNVQVAGGAGVTAIIEPGGSVRDAQVIAAAEEYGMAVVFTGTRHFRH